jgi:hypothetical protein
MEERGSLKISLNNISKCPFVVYLTTLLHNSDYIASNERAIMNYEFEKVWKEVVVA